MGSASQKLHGTFGMGSGQVPSMFGYFPGRVLGGFGKIPQNTLIENVFCLKAEQLHN